MLARAPLSGLVAALLFACFSGTASSCSAFDAESASADPDASANGDTPITGTPAERLALKIPSERIVLRHGEKVSIRVEITRSRGFDGEVRVRVNAQPSGAFAGDLVLGPSTTSGELVVIVGFEAPQGELVGAVVEAASPDGTARATAPLVGFVRGAPGEIDTTFANGGVVPLARPYELAGGLADGTFFVAERKVPNAGILKFSLDGKPDTTFGEKHALGTASLHHLVVKNDRIWLSLESLPNQAPTWHIQRLNLDGTPDFAFANAAGVSDRQLPPTGGFLTGFAVNPTGRSVQVGPRQTSTSIESMYVRWETADGSPDTSVNPQAASSDARTADSVTTALYDDTGIWVCGGTRIGRVSRAGGAYDAGYFGGQGYAYLQGGMACTNLLVDSKRRVVVFGTEGAPPAPVGLAAMRFTPTGAADPTFNFRSAGLPQSVAAGFVALDEGDKLLRTDGCNIVRTRDDGSPDPTFGTNGVVTRSPCTRLGQIVVQPGGRAVIAGDRIVRIWL